MVGRTTTMQATGRWRDVLELTSLKRMVQEATSETETARDLSQRDRYYYDGQQDTPEQRAALRKKKQPDITINRIKRKIDAMVGIEQRGRTDPRALPRNPNDEEAADVATKGLVYVEETQKIDVKASAAFENLLIEGYGGVEVVHQQGRDGSMDVAVRRLRWEDIFYDPYSREKDFSDATYMGILKWMSEDVALAYCQQFWDGSPEDLAALLDSKQDIVVSGSYDDRPNAGMWVDTKNRRVRVAQCYYQSGGVWHLSIFTGRGELYNDRSPYMDEHGEPRCAMILMSAYVDSDNRRYGVVRDMIGAQDEINRRRRLGVHFLNSRQTWAVKGAVDVPKLKHEMSQPDGHIEVNVDEVLDGIPPFTIIPTADMAQGNLALLQEAKGEIDMLGPNASLLGQLGGAQSGRAIMAQQQAGLAELAPIYDSKRDWTERVYRACWAAIRQFWTGPKWIRITDDVKGAQFVGINQPVMDPMTGQVQVMNPIAEIDVDIIIDMAPEYATLRAEQFEKLADMAMKGLPIPPALIIEASDLRDKQKLIEAMEQGPPPEVMQAQQRGAEAEIAVQEAKAFRDTAAGQKDLAAIGSLQAKGQIEGITAAAKTAIAQRVLPSAAGM